MSLALFLTIHKDGGLLIISMFEPFISKLETSKPQAPSTAFLYCWADGYKHRLENRCLLWTWCIYTEIWIPQQPIKIWLKHEKEILPRTFFFTFILCNFSVRTIFYIHQMAITVTSGIFWKQRFIYLILFVVFLSVLKMTKLVQN